MNWTAKYDGTCARCEGRFRADVDDIYAVADGYVHVTCPDPLAIPTQGVCPSCHLTLPATGVCGEC